MRTIGVGGRAVRLATNRPGAVVAAVGALMLAAYLASIVLSPKPDGRVVLGDALHQFVQLRSLVFDHDLDFRNEYFRLYGLKGNEPGTEWVTTELTVTGRVRNYMPVGPALLDAPLYLLMSGVERGLSLAGLADRPDGYSRALQATTGVTGVLAATLAAWLSWRLARRYSASATASAALFATWLGSSAIYYSMVSPSYSHSASMLASAVFFSYWMDEGRPASIRRSVLLGVLAGIATLMRWQDVIFLAVAAFESPARGGAWRRRVVHLAATGAGWLLAFSPQMAVWQVLYGQPLAVPQGPSFMRWTAPHLLDVLVSLHGLFSWTPLVVLAVAGLAAFGVRRRQFALPLAVVLLVSWYVNGAVADWWAGEAFGARRFLSLFPLFVVGLAAWLQPDEAADRPRGWRVATAFALAGANLLLLFQYQLFMKGLRAIASYPSGWFGLCVDRFIVPFKFLAWWLR
jgi:hypothetical protein